MLHFPSWQSYQTFAQRVRLNSRYFRDRDLDRFCKMVIATATERRRNLKKGSLLCRSQIGEAPERQSKAGGFEQPSALPPARMIPLKNKALEGRANPKGIPYLYLATDLPTAIAESRAGRAESISVGTFQVQRSLTVVDCSILSLESLKFYLKEPTPKERTTAVWTDIDHAFSQPVNRSDDTADYAPTQILAELFKHNGFDGIVYRSSLAPGRNIVLFDLNSVQLMGCGLYEITKVAIEFEQSANPYVFNHGRSSRKRIKKSKRMSPNAKKS